MSDEKNCFNCAFCSEGYPSFVDTCDKDNHVVKNVYSEKCGDFARIDSDDKT